MTLPSRVEQGRFVLEWVYRPCLLSSVLGLLGGWALHRTAYTAYGIVSADGIEPPRPQLAH